MPKNKFAIIRFETLNECFRSKKWHFMDDLIEACCKAIAEYTGEEMEEVTVSKRTVQGDIYSMKKIYSIPLKQERCTHPDTGARMDRYFYLDRSFDIRKQPLSEEEKVNLKEAFSILSRMSHMKSLSWLDETISGLKVWSGGEVGNSETLVFEESPRLRGIEYMKPIYNAIRNKKVLLIKYHSFATGQNYNFKVSPYFLKQYNKRWYLFGQEHTNMLPTLHNLPLDRMQFVETCEEAYVENNDIKPKDYFEDVIGVTFNQAAQKEKVLLRVQWKHWHYIDSKPFHHSQRILATVPHEYVDISLEVIPNFELESVILSRGAEIQVLKPQWFRDKIKEKVEQMLNNYLENITT